MTAVAFASVDSLYEIDGSAFNERNRTKGPKALVNVGRSMGKDNIAIERHDPHIGYIIQDSIHISLKKSEQWLEMEKNTAYSICVDDSKGGIWKVNDFSYNKETDNCIQLYSGNYVKSGKIQYATKMGNGYTLNLLVGMKYIDLRGKRHLLGFKGSEYKLKKEVIYEDMESNWNNRIYPDSFRYEPIDEVLAVDKYKVTECEFVQALWDSIPAKLIGNEWIENQNFWIQKKKSITKNKFCDANDSAAIKIRPYQALMYANIRSIHDGLKPVYSITDADVKYTQWNEDGSFIMEKETFHDSDRDSFVRVSVNKLADGYRLPYYYEWMALARGGEANYRYIWGDESDSSLASQYAWFGVRDPEDHFLRLSKNDTWHKHSCGRWLQKSRPVGMLKPNTYGLYDMVGLVCENVLMPGKSLFSDEIFSCKGGFLPDSLESLNFGSHCDTGRSWGNLRFQGLRLVRQIK